MKIIAQSEGENYIAVVSKRELANIMGYYYEGEAHCPEIRVNAIIKVTEAYSALGAIRDLGSKVKTIESAANGLLDVIRLKHPLIQPIIETAEKKVH